MASIYYARYPTGKRSPYWSLRCWLRGQKKHHYLSLRYPDGRRVANTRDAWRMCREHEVACHARRTSSHQVATALEEYLRATAQERSPAVQIQAQRRAAKLADVVGPLPLHDLSRDRIETALTRLMQERQLNGITRDHYLKLIRAFCRWCVIVKDWLPKDPSQGIAHIGKPSSRDFLPQERWGEFLALAKRSKYYPGTATALMTGLRRGELLRMVAGDFSVERREIRVRREVSKTRQEVLLPMMQELAPILRPVLAAQQPQERAFPYYAERWRVTVKGWLVALGCRKEGAGLHTLRHSFCTWAYERFGEYKGQLLARHQSLEMARHYVHLRAMPVSPGQMTLRIEEKDGDTR